MMANTAAYPLRRLTPDDDFGQALDLVQCAFAYMDARIDPPSSMHLLTADGMRQQAATSEVWVMEDGRDVLATMTLTPRENSVYLGKLAVADTHRGQGLARQMVCHAGHRALALGLPIIALQSRIELTENHAIFARLGFREVAHTAHPGYDRPTSITFQKTVAP